MTDTVPLKDICEQYVAAHTKAKEADAALDALKPVLLAAMKEANVEEAALDEGVIAIQSRPKWQYPAEVTALEAQLKEARTLAEQTGTATSTPGASYPVFKAARAE